MLLLASCSKNPSSSPGSFGEQESSDENNTGDSIPLIKSKEPTIVEDEERLIKIRIDDGVPTISFNRKAWVDIHDMENLAEAYNGIEMTIEEKELSIKTISGKVADAAILKIDALDVYKTFDFTEPTVFLLMENGTVEWFTAPARLITEEGGRSSEYTDSLKVPWLKDIVEIYCDNESEGIGDMTVFAKDSSGLNYDLRIPCGFYWNLDYIWECVLATTDDGVDYLGIMDFDEEGNFSFKTGFRESETDECYSGSYDISLDEESSKGYRAGMMKLDLSLDYSDWEGNRPNKINGIFFTINVQDESITLMSGDGDTLVAGTDVYEFTPHEYKGR